MQPTDSGPDWNNRRVTRQSASKVALATVGAVRDDPAGRLALMRNQYRVPPDVDRGYLPYRQAASAFMRWQLRRGLLNAIDAPRPGSPWWRAINERLLYDVGEARAFAFGHPGPPSSSTVATWLEFIRRPGAARWYRAHNMSIVGAYMENEHLAAREGRIDILDTRRGCMKPDDARGEEIHREIPRLRLHVLRQSERDVLLILFQDCFPASNRSQFPTLVMVAGLQPKRSLGRWIQEYPEAFAVGCDGADQGELWSFGLFRLRRRGRLRRSISRAGPIRRPGRAARSRARAMR